MLQQSAMVLAKRPIEVVVMGFFHRLAGEFGP
jgi:hypothetical protein